MNTLKKEIELRLRNLVLEDVVDEGGISFADSLEKACAKLRRVIESVRKKAIKEARCPA